MLVGLLTPKLSRLHAFSRAARLHRFGRNGLITADLSSRSGNSPGYSGGAVPESHRSSLFAGRSQLQTIGHQIRWRSVSVVPPLSSCAGRPTITGTAFHAAGAGVKPCRLRRQTASICSGSTALRRTGCTRGAHGILCPQHATSRVSKNTWVSLKPLSPARR